MLPIRSIACERRRISGCRLSLPKTAISKMRNGERGTGNGERGTGNGESGNRGIGESGNRGIGESGNRGIPIPIPRSPSPILEKAAENGGDKRQPEIRLRMARFLRSQPNRSTKRVNSRSLT